MSAAKRPRFPQMLPTHYETQFTPEALARRRQLSAAAEAVFGNHINAGVWLFKYMPEFAGGRRQPIDAASDSEQGLAAALAELERIRPTITPEPLPRSVTHPKSRRRR